MRSCRTRPAQTQEENLRDKDWWMFNPTIPHMSRSDHPESNPQMRCSRSLKYSYYTRFIKIIIHQRSLFTYLSDYWNKWQKGGRLKYLCHRYIFVLQICNNLFHYYINLWIAKYFWQRIPFYWVKQCSGCDWMQRVVMELRVFYMDYAEHTFLAFTHLWNVHIN